MILRRIAKALGLEGVDRLTVWIFAAAIVISSVLRFVVAPQIPLWLDETWTGGIAGQPSWADVIRQTWLDANAPLYYLFMHGWIGLFGQSNISLRAPSLIFGLATPFVPLLIKVDSWRPQDRFALGVMLAVWTQGYVMSQEARCYTLLLLLAAIQTLAFARLMREPSLRRALIWAGLGSLVMATHYQATALGAVQGLIYLAVHRMRAVRTFPALIGYAPGFAVLAWHLPRLLQFARPDVAWYDLVTPDAMVEVVNFITDRWPLLFLPAAGLILVMVQGLSRKAPPPRSTAPAALWLAGLSALIGLVLVVGIGVVRPSFALRYATPFVPGLFLLASLLTGCLTPVFPLARIALMLMVLANSTLWGATSAGKLWRFFTYEAASRDLVATHPTRLVFIWDHPAQQVEDESQYVAAGGFFFRRAGANIPVTAVMVRPGDDPNLKLVAAAREPGAVILWIYDVRVHGTAATGFRPRIPVVDPSFGCHQYGRGRFGVLACSRRFEKGALAP